MEKEKLITVVGAENTLDDRDTLRAYSQDHSFAPSRQPSYVVRPLTAAQVQQLVRLAAETRTPLVPVSSGEPRFRGDTVGESGRPVA